TVEEVTFHAIVRTTEPEIKGTTLTDPDALPGPLADRIAVLAEATAPRAVREGPAMAPQTMRLDPTIVSDHLRDGQPGAALGTASLTHLQRLTDVKRLRHIIDVIGPYLTPGRVSLDSE